ncbi:MAG: DUF4160 domain-containing protein [Chitinophagales bacterium]|nr:DUF4160 domain-containing protein [Chitinophagales bacterium]
MASTKRKLALTTLPYLEGNLPPKALALVVEWATIHQAELKENWRRVEEHEVLKTIEPLI